MEGTPLWTAQSPLHHQPNAFAPAEHKSLPDHADVNIGHHKLDEYTDDRQNKYDLRPQARELKSNFTRTWFDDDKTGFYDPKEELRKLRQRPKRSNSLLRAGGFRPWDLHDESDEANETCRKRGPKLIPKLEVTLTFKNEAGKAAFVKHALNLHAQPRPSEDLFSERRLRCRDSGVDLPHKARTRSKKHHHLPDDLPSDLTGHPVARGCWECLTLGIRCPLLDDAHAWPCTACLDDNNECELITPPTYKRACERCKSRRVGCSYTYTLDHEGPCEECSHTGWNCVAGPANQAIRDRLSYDRDWKTHPWQEPKVPKPKKLPTCLRCRERGQPCSFSTGDKSETCTACDMVDATCAPELENPQRSRKRERPLKFGARTDSATRGPEVSDEDVDILGINHDSERKEAKPQPIIINEHHGGSKATETPTPRNRKKTKPNSNEGQLSSISTNFAHPIAFNHEDPGRCHFCNDIRFSMFGLDRTDVKVVIWKDGRGLEEISGGHRGRGVENTRMCVACTTRRIPVLMCSKHELRPLSGTVTDSAVFGDEALASLLHGTTTGQERWCSICPSLAQYECCAAGAHGRGCGLQLCEQCMVPVTAAGGDLRQMLDKVQDEPTRERILGLRADHEFLKHDGLLMRYVLWESQDAGC